MNKVHQPHRKSGYIAKVDFQQTTDRNGKPDWIMFYLPGPKARAEYRAFTKRGGPTVLEIEPLEPSPPLPLEAAMLSELERELIGRGVSPSAAKELVREHSEEKIRAQIERLDWLLEKKPEKVEDPAAYLACAIRNDYAAPKGFVSQAERQRREEAKRLKAEQAEQARRRLREEEARKQAEFDAIQAYLAGLSPEQLAKHQADAVAAANPTSRTLYQDPNALPNIKQTMLRLMSEEHAGRILGHAARDA